VRKTRLSTKLSSNGCQNIITQKINIVFNMFISTVNYSPTSTEKIQMAFTHYISKDEKSSQVTLVPLPQDTQMLIVTHSQNTATRQLSSSASTTKPVEKIQQRNV
jgi:hypothetical protein